MSNRRRGSVLATACLVLLSVASHARADPITLTFEDLPDAHLYEGGQENIGDFYPGVTFGPAVFGGKSFGNTLIFSAFTSLMSVEFASPITSFSVMYSAFDPLPLEFFDTNGVLLGSLTGPPNRPGDFEGHFDLLRFTMPGISRVLVHGADPGLFVLDDLTYTPVPEPGAIIMLGLGGTLVALRRRAR